jgi:predicted AlkP superfamily phosphohydrolase/phosphomutase
VTRTGRAAIRRWAAACLLLAVLPAPAEAYIGPGAGFALLSSFFVVFTTILLAGLSLLTWPVRILWRKLRHGQAAKPLVRRLIVIGFDGKDPQLTERYMAEGKLPNLSRLARQGCYRPLRTTYPSISPCAWSSFGTGCHPAKHRIYDFLERDVHTYLPQLSSTRIGTVDTFLKLGRWRIPLRKPELRLTRKSKPFWTILGENNVWSTVLRVPITFPPEKFRGAQLSAMCTPDLLGSQGTFLLFTTRPAQGAFKEGGARFPLQRDGDGWTGILQGPENLFLEGSPPMTLPLTIHPDGAPGRARVRVRDTVVDVKLGELTDWVKLAFQAAPGIKVRGICRMQLQELGEHATLYVTPLNIDPEHPAMPISHPSYYATYLAHKIGPYATLGLAEDTWALNESVIDDGTFLQLAHDIDRERQQMFLAGLDRLRQGTLTCVFDATDRIQHMFWRYLEPGHPAAHGHEHGPHEDAIEKIYARNDAFVGQVMERLRKDDVLMVISDHGFASFRRGVNLNAWLLRNGYLALKPGADGRAEWLADVDWSATRAYALGLAGLYLNVRGREKHGVVEPGAELARLKAELIAKLSGLVDEEKGSVGVVEMFDTSRLYQGPYIGDAPDLLIGYNRGYRVSWDCATGMVAGPVFEDNVKAWSGDHTVDPRLVPGVFFCSHAIDVEDPSLIDIAPTAVRLFGLTPPAHMDGKPLFAGRPQAARPAPRPADAA